MIEFNNVTKSKINLARLQKLLKLINQILKNRGEQTISLVFVSPLKIKSLNKIYRGKNKVTDVLSFNIADELDKSNLGEIIICASRATTQAREFKHSFQKEIERLFLHGYLHLCGFDHEKEKEAVMMESLEEKVLKKFYV